jgi:hypothetical protein
MEPGKQFLQVNLAGSFCGGLCKAAPSFRLSGKSLVGGRRPASYPWSYSHSFFVRCVASFHLRFTPH